jgi:hypothetical protein
MLGIIEGDYPISEEIHKNHSQPPDFHIFHTKDDIYRVVEVMKQVSNDETTKKIDHLFFFTING